MRNAKNRLPRKRASGRAHWAPRGRPHTLGGRGARRAGGGGWPAPGRATLHLDLPYRWTYPTGAPTLHLDLPYRCAYPTLAPTLHVRLPYTSTYPTAAPTLH